MSKTTYTILISITIVLILCCFCVIGIVLINNSTSSAVEKKISAAQEYFDSGDYDSAIEEYKEAIEMDDTNADAYLGIAASYYGRYKKTNNSQDLDMAINYLENGRDKTNKDSRIIDLLEEYQTEQTELEQGDVMPEEIADNTSSEDSTEESSEEESSSESEESEDISSESEDSSQKNEDNSLIYAKYKETLEIISSLGDTPREPMYTIYDVDNNGDFELIVIDQLGLYSIYTYVDENYLGGLTAVQCIGNEDYNGLYVADGYGMIIYREYPEYSGVSYEGYKLYISLMTLDHDEKVLYAFEENNDESHAEFLSILNSYTLVDNFYPIDDYSYLTAVLGVDA